MKVSELIERLNEFDPEQEVEVWAGLFGADTRDIVDIEEDQGIVVIEVE
jgi:hypothetical protein